MSYAALKVELAKPAYAAMSDVQARDALNAPIAGEVDKASLTGGEILSVVDQAEYTALAAGPKAFVDRVIGAGGPIPLTASFKAILGAIFPAGTTRTRLVALVKRGTSSSLAVQVFGAPVSEHDVAHARTL